jgi:hypothetical protein
VKSELIQSKTNFGFHLDGDNEIDAELLSKTIHDVVKLTNLAAKEENPEAYLKMNVTAFKNGSFQIDFSTICEFANTLFNNANILTGFAASVVTVVGGFFAIKKHLKGEAAQKVSEPDCNGNINVINSTGEILSVKKSSGAILENVQIDNLTVNISEYVLQHNPNGGFSLDTENGKFSYTADDVKAISKSLPIEEKKKCQIETANAILLIKKADLLGRSSWEFKYGKHTIHAKVLDDDLIDIAHSGAPIRAGDYIHAKLEIRTDLDEFDLPIEGTEQYSVLKADGGILHQKDIDQTHLF